MYTYILCENMCLCIQCAARAKPPPCRTCGWKLKKAAWKINRFRCKIRWKIDENWGSRGTFAVVGDALGSKMAQDAIWSASGAPFGWLLGRILAPRWAKMAPSWPTWRQDVPKMANLEAKMANLAHFWEHLGDLFWILGAILPKMTKTKKTTTVHHFWRFFGVLGLLLEAMLAHLGAMLRHLGAILEQLGDKMAPKSAKMSQDSAQERQDETRYRKWVPKRGEGSTRVAAAELHAPP